MEVYAFILARGGSKGLPGKNVKDLCGKPMIAWTIEAALAAPEVTKVFVSTDDEEIAKASREYGAVVLERPAEMAQDHSLAQPVFEYHLNELAKEGFMPDIVVDLRPTSPLRMTNRISEGINLLVKKGREVDSVRAVMVANKHPYKMWKMDEEGLIKPFLSKDVTGMDEPYDSCREDLPVVHQNNGAMYAIWPKTILEKNTLTGDRVLGYVMEDWESVNIDNELDFMMAELLMKQKFDIG